MEIKTATIAGTLESSDAQVTLAPHVGGNQINLDSSVQAQYGKHIQQLITTFIQTFDLINVAITVVDHGALDCTIKARLETAYYRAVGQPDRLPWEVL